MRKMLSMLVIASLAGTTLLLATAPTASANWCKIDDHDVVCAVAGQVVSVQRTVDETREEIGGCVVGNQPCW